MGHNPSFFVGGSLGQPKTYTWANLPYENYWSHPTDFKPDVDAPRSLTDAGLDIVRQALDVWEAVSSVRFEWTDYPNEAHIIAFMHDGDGPGGELGVGAPWPAHAIQPWHWSGHQVIGFDSHDFPDFEPGLAPELLNKALRVAVHDIGHAIYIRDLDAPAAMEANFSLEAFPILQPNDIAAVQRLYGAPPEYTSPWEDTDDTLYAVTAGSRVWGRGGDDVIVGRAGDDILYGNRGDDQLSGGDGNNTLYGGRGDDFLVSNNEGDGADVLYGNRGDDYLVGYYDADAKLYGGKGNDTLRGSQGNSTVYGGKGDDNLSASWMEGGLGADRFLLLARAGVTNRIQDFDPDEGDYLVVFNDNPVIRTGAGPEGHLRVAFANGGAIDLVGVAPEEWDPDWTVPYGRLVVGDDGDNAFVWGGGGEDTLISGAGNDTMRGHSGADQFHIDAGAGEIDTIEDFSPTEGDYLVYNEANPVANIASAPEGHLRIHLASGGKVDLLGIAPEAWDPIWAVSSASLG